MLIEVELRGVDLGLVLLNLRFGFGERRLRRGDLRFVGAIVASCLIEVGVRFKAAWGE